MSHILRNIWDACNGESHIHALSGRLFRLVESQQQVATRQYVDSLEEQAVLEEMLESVKPPYPEMNENLHYLLKSPFRYPPLKWGSRFGRTHEPSIFYGGSHLLVTLAESAYYRFVFWYSMLSPAPKPVICTQHTSFAVDYSTQYGIELNQPPFDQYQSQLVHPTDYSVCQSLGTAMRQANVEVFHYSSARSNHHDTCIGLIRSTCFIQKEPIELQQWLCDLGADEVLFKSTTDRKIYRFALTDFLVNDHFPMPA